MTVNNKVGGDEEIERDLLVGRNLTVRGVISGGSGVNYAALSTIVEVTWETESGVILTVPDNEVWTVEAVACLSIVTWDGAGASLAVGKAGLGQPDDNGYLDVVAADLVAQTDYGSRANDRGLLLWENDVPNISFLNPGQTVTILVTPGAGASAGTSYIAVMGWRFPAPDLML